MVYNEREERHLQVVQVAKQMMTAARTAPKSKGLDIQEIIIIEGDEIEVLSKKMLEMAEEMNLGFMIRDANNIIHAECIVFVGTRELVMGLNCGHCGFKTCGERSKGVPCSLNVVDVGIALGSACATASDLRVDTRVMFSAGLVAQHLNWLEGCTQVYGIALSASSKNPFFDRPSAK